MNLSIIICTHNRANLLDLCLKSLLIDNDLEEGVEIIVVDNNSKEDIKQVLSKFNIPIPRVSYYFESNTGLSFARNRGLKEANGEWLFFLDDDAKITSNLIGQIEHTIKNFDFELFSGIWRAWYRTPPPKWLPNATGNYILKGDSSIRLIGEDYISGGVMCIKKDVLIKVGGFPTELGMTGKSIGYGEESFVEAEVKKRGYKVGINPNIIIEHLVGEYKYSILWHLKSAWARGKANRFITKTEPSRILENIKSLLNAFILRPIYSLGALIIRKNYFWQNFIIDSLGGICYQIGRLIPSKK